MENQIYKDNGINARDQNDPTREIVLPLYIPGSSMLQITSTYMYKNNN